MGGGSYSVNRATTRSNDLNYKTRSTREVFSKTSLDNAMNPNGVKIRESRDSDEHPDSISIVLGLDVTGSMGNIPHHMVAEGLTTTMGTILQRGVTDPQILFLGIGDHEVDNAPLQVAQFESSDPKLDGWLKDVYLEGGGGGNAGESYLLAWYFAGYHTSIDCFEKRNKKGYLFTIGDEPTLKEISQHQIRDIMGSSTELEQDTISAQKLLEEAEKMYHVRHLHVTQTRTGSQKHVQGDWKQLMGDNVIMVDDVDNIPKVMSEVILEGEKGTTSTVSTKPTKSEDKKDEVIL